MLASHRLDASLTPSQLRAVLQAQPHRSLEVAIHPGSDELLRQWLWGRGDDEFRRAVHAHYLQQRDRLLRAGVPLPEAAVRYETAFSQLIGSVIPQGQETASGPRTEEIPNRENHTARPGRSAARLGLPDGTAVDLVSERIVIGSKPSAVEFPGAQLVTIADPNRQLDASHALLARVGRGWQITDLHSGNGTVLGAAPNRFQAHPGIAYQLPEQFSLAGQRVQLLVA